MISASPRPTVMEPFAQQLRQTGMDRFGEDQHQARLPDVVEKYLAGQRSWHRLLRESGLVSADEAAADLERWM